MLLILAAVATIDCISGKLRYAMIGRREMRAMTVPLYTDPGGREKLAPARTASLRAPPSDCATIRNGFFCAAPSPDLLKQAAKITSRSPPPSSRIGAMPAGSCCTGARMASSTDCRCASPTHSNTHGTAIANISRTVVDEAGLISPAVVIAVTGAAGRGCRPARRAAAKPRQKSSAVLNAPARHRRFDPDYVIDNDGPLNAAVGVLRRSGAPYSYVTQPVSG